MRMSAVYTTTTVRFVSFPQHIWIFPSHLMCLPHVWTDTTQTNSWSDSLEIKTQRKKTEIDRGWDIKEERERARWGWAGTCLLTDPNVLAANLLSYQQWNMLQLGQFLSINLITKKYNHLNRHTSRLLHVNNPASLESQNYVNYYKNHPKWLMFSSFVWDSNMPVLASTLIGLVVKQMNKYASVSPSDLFCEYSQSLRCQCGEEGNEGGL